MAALRGDILVIYYIKKCCYGNTMKYYPHSLLSIYCTTVWVVYHINPIATLFKGKKVHLEQITQRLVASLLT
jgi:hypothetical protein